MDEPARGMVVMGPGGQLGTVDQVVYENSGEPARVLVQRPNGESMMLQPGSYQVQGGVLRLGAGTGGFQRELAPGSSLTQMGGDDIYRTQQLGSAGSVQTLDVQAGEGMVIPVIREEVKVTRRAVERGGVRVHKRIEEREEVVEQPTYREEVTVERVALGQPIDQAIGSRQEGDTLIIPVLEEMLVVEKRLVLKEEIRITKRRFDETEQARILLREERIEIENIDDSAAMA